jgi:hypothetical protein
MKPNKKGYNSMTVTEFARLGGKTITKAKSEAARKNGKLGGRPGKDDGSKRIESVFKQG